MADDLIKIEVKGMDELADKLRRLDTKMERKTLRQSIRAGCVEFQNALVNAAPRWTGWLAERSHFTIRTRKTAEGMSAKVGPTNSRSVGVHPDVEHRTGQRGGKTGLLQRTPAWLTMVLEFGTHGKHHHPYASQAVEGAKQRAADAVVERLKDILDTSDL